jgi:3-phenylpropionate/trans-cinnamate dioxygenase ferredoxin reductase subunit
MEYRGHSSPGDEVVVRGSLAERSFIALWVRDGRVVAGMNANIWDVAKPIERLIRSRAEVDVARLADPSEPIEEVAGEPAAA